MERQTATEVVLHQGRNSQELMRENFMPVFDIESAVARQKSMSEFIGKILRESTKDEAGDYGVIPGTNKQKVLLKPGAEKLCTFFGLSPHFEAEHITEDWVGLPEHGKEPLFYYRYKCQLYRGDRFISEAVGSCSSREKKYRYRSAERVCPECGKAAIIKGKAEYGGGFLCFGKKGGCGAKFKDDDQAIIGQEVGQVANPDIADVVNTCQKIAQKRALVAAVLIGTNASDSFTQDLDEDIDTGGHAKGTQEAADYVRDQKIKGSATQAGNPPTPAAAEGRGETALTAPITPEVEALMKRCTNVQTVDAVCGELCALIEKSVGQETADKVWADAIAQYGDPAIKRAAWRPVVMFLYQQAETARAVAA